MGTQLHLSDEQLPDYLRGLGLAGPDDAIAVETAGDGNINWVRRATIRGPGATSLIIKQARPRLEQFPEYEAPTERLAFEARWFEVAAAWDPDGICPVIHRFDEENRVLILEDIGHAERMDAALARGADVEAPAIALAAFLGRVHAATDGDPGLAARFRNEAMQRLHGDHIFLLPYTEAFPCPPETAKRADGVRADETLAAIAARAYERYLTPRGVLVHADVQATNVLLDGGRPKLLDAEIAHVGDPAFDPGTLLAHLALPAIARGDAVPKALLANVWSAYAAAAGDAAPDPGDVVRIAGLELIRRTIGAARVAAVGSDAAGLRVLDAGIFWVRTPPVSALGV